MCVCLCNMVKICLKYHPPRLHIRWSKYWSFSVSPSIEYSGLIFFRIDWVDLLAVQEIRYVEGTGNTEMNTVLNAL